MPSRRRFLATAAGFGATASSSGCLTDLGLAESGYLQVKGVSVTWRHRGRRWEDEVLAARSDGESELRCRVAEAYASIVGSPTEIRVTEEVERRLDRNFVDVIYVAGFCWSDEDGHTCRNSQASRATFNRVQFGDRAEVVFDSPHVEVLDVYEGTQGDPHRWEADVTTFDFGALHDDHGVPVSGGSTV